MHGKLDPPSLDAVLGSASAIANGRLAGEGPAGKLPLTPDMLREEPSGNLFGLTQNVGMGWSPTALDGPQYVIVSTHGGLRSEDGSPPCVLTIDRKSTRLNSSHSQISYAVF